MNMEAKQHIDCYAHSAYSYGEAMENGDYNAANIYFDKNSDAHQHLLRLGDRGGRALMELLEHENVHVRISAATHLLSTFRKEALEVLETLSTAPGFPGFTAQMALEDLKKGNLAVPKFKLSA